MKHPTRRELLQATPLVLAPNWLLAAESKPPFPGMILRQSEPLNLEMPLAAFDDWTTPTERLYVRSHFATPKIDPKAFKLVVEGHVENKLELSLDDVKNLESATKPLLLECAGNGRVFLTPAVRGLQWANGAVGNPEWTGTLLNTLLERARPKAGAVDVVLVGADTGAITADPATPGSIPFSRSLPLAKAKKPEVILAWSINGEDLTPSHGFPLRAVVGGWYGMASVKWLRRIIVTDRPYQGYFQTMDYSFFKRPTGANPETVPVTEIQPKAVIAHPISNTVVAVGKALRISGTAWAGESPVAKVEVSRDGGTSWSAAKFAEKPKPFCWVKWTSDWTPMEPGPVKLVARCTDEAGAIQSEKRDADRRTYAINHLIPVEVIVR